VNQPWSMIIHIGYLGIFMLIAMVIRRSIPRFSRFRIPDAIIAGLLTLAAKPAIALLAQIEGLGLPAVDNSQYHALAYHLLAVGFIALSLKRETHKGRGRTAISAGFFNVASYCIQGFVGLGITLILMSTIYPDLFPGIGLLLPFGFAQGPMAGEMALEWAGKVSATGMPAFPSAEAASTIGFSFSTIGFLWACFAGVPLMNYLIRRRKRRGKPDPVLSAKSKITQTRTQTEKTGLGRLVDRASTQLILIALVYILVFASLKGLTALLTTLGGETGIIQTIVGIFWSIHFVFGAIIATLVAKVIHSMQDRGTIKAPVTDNLLLQRIGGAAVDFMIASSIAAINVDILADYIGPILIITTAGGISVIAYTWFIVRKVWPKTYVEHFVAFFGEQTGTIATGMALLRGVDPEFRTRAASDIVYGSAIALPLVSPLIFIATLPIEGFETGNTSLYWITLAAVLGYLILALVIWFIPPVFNYLTRFSMQDGITS
jgi:ESS family glutamate:Na+ symporter